MRSHNDDNNDDDDSDNSDNDNKVNSSSSTTAANANNNDDDAAKPKINYFAAALASALEAPLPKPAPQVTQLTANESGAVEATDVVDPILAGTMTTHQRNAQRLVKRQALVVNRSAERAKRLNQFHNKDPSMVDGEKALSKLACEGGTQAMACESSTVKRSRFCVVVQLFNALKRQRKELAIAKRKTMRVKDKEKLAITPKSFFTKLHADKAKRDSKNSGDAAASSSSATTSATKPATPSKWSVLSENFLVEQTDKIDEDQQQ